MKPQGNRIGPLHGVGLLGLLAFGYLVWPTPYEYARKAPDVYRVHRVTGVREVSTASGWRTSPETSALPSPSVAQPLPDAGASARKAGKDLGETALGSKGEYSARVRIAYGNNRLSYELSLKPFAGPLKAAADYRRTRIATLNLYSSSGFVIFKKELTSADFARVNGLWETAQPAGTPPGTVPEGTSGRKLLGKLGQAIKETAISARPGGKVYYVVKPYEYLVLRTSDKSGTYKVLLQNGRDGYVPSSHVAKLPYDVTAPIGGQTFSEKTGVRLTYLQSEGVIEASAAQYDDVASYSVSWSW